MGDSLRTTITQFSSAGGQVQPRAVNARAVEPAADLPGAERGSLYLLVEVIGSGGGHAALYRQMLNAAQTAFYEASGTQSSALVRAVRSAHLVLVEANQALPEAKWRAGISVAALQGQELMIAQAGPALALVSHAKTVDMYPADPRSPTTPLGGEQRPDVQLYRTTVEPGTILMLAQSNWLDHATPETLAAVAAAQHVSVAAEYLHQLAGSAELSALLVGFGESAAWAGEAEARAARAERREPALEGRTRGPAVEAAEPLPEMKTIPAAPAEGAPAGAAPAVRHRSLWPLLLAVIVIPLLIAAIVVAMLWMRQQAADTQFAELLTGAETAITEAQGLPDDLAARQRLGAAREFLDQARGLRPEDPQLATLEARYQEILDQVDHVIPLYGILPLWEFQESGRQPGRVLVSGDSLFVLDRGQQEVLRFKFASPLKDSIVPAEESVVLRKSQQVGDLILSDLVDMAWAEAVGNQRSRLLVLDTAGNLAGYDVTWGPAGVPLAGREQWGLPQLMASYGGNLYIADVKANQIWRYRPGDQGYENPPERYFAANTQVDLRGLQAMAIDGHVWLLFADGRLPKFFVGEQQPFELRGLPNPLSAPTALAVPLEGDRLYIADAGNGRIVEVTKDGRFQRQFRPSEGDVLRRARDVFLDAAGSAFYILTDNGLYKASLPAATPTPTQ